MRTERDKNKRDVNKNRWEQENDKNKEAKKDKKTGNNRDAIKKVRG